jgi:hypothetical protein
LLNPTHLSVMCIRLLSLLVSCTSFFHLWSIGSCLINLKNDRTAK